MSDVVMIFAGAVVVVAIYVLCQTVFDDSTVERDGKPKRGESGNKSKGVPEIRPDPKTQGRKDYF